MLAGPWLASTMFLNFNYLLIAGSGPGSACDQSGTSIQVTWSVLTNPRPASSRSDNFAQSSVKEGSGQITRGGGGCPRHKSSRLTSDGTTLIFIRRSQHVFSSSLRRPTLYIQLPETDQGNHIFWGNKQEMACQETIPESLKSKERGVDKYLPNNIWKVKFLLKQYIF